MKLFADLKKLFKGKKNLSVADIMESMDKQAHYTFVNGKYYARLWAVADIDKGFARVADGFTCKADAKAFCLSCSFNWYLFPYETEAKDSYTE